MTLTVISDCYQSTPSVFSSPANPWTVTILNIQCWGQANIHNPLLCLLTRKNSVYRILHLQRVVPATVFCIYISIFKHFLELTAPNKNILIVTRLSGSATCSGYFYFCVISVYTSLFFNFRSNSKTSFLHNSIASLQVYTSSPSISMLSSPGYLVEK